jgi:hypothetical protein
MARETRVVESVDDRTAELFLGAVALEGGGPGVGAATLRPTGERDESDADGASDG